MSRRPTVSTRVAPPAVLPSMSGRVCIVTGANSGIGAATAEGLARAGATVVMACRDRARSEPVRRAMIARTGNSNIVLFDLDLANLAAVRKFVERFTATYKRLDVLVNNAAVMPAKRGLSADGFEMQFAVNHLGPFLLTRSLLPLMQATGLVTREAGQGPARIVMVSSGLHKDAKLNLKDLQTRSNYSPWKAYAVTKLENLLFVEAMAQRLSTSAVTINALHPGVVETGLTRSVKHTSMARDPHALTPTEGAATSLLVATSPALATSNGKYIVGKKAIPPAPHARDRKVAAALWMTSSELVGLPA